MGENSRGPRRRRVTAAARELNRRPALVEAARRTRKWAMGDEKVLHRLPTARGRPSDLAVRQLAALTADTPGVLGELGLTVLQAWQRVSIPHCAPGLQPGGDVIIVGGQQASPSAPQG